MDEMDENVWNCIGNGNITDFDTIEELDKYFTIENFISMFRECNQTPEEMAELREHAKSMFVRL